MSDGYVSRATLAGFRVKAQPMMRDEQTGWLPLNLQRVDPLSIVTLEICDGQYNIVAHRIADSKEILRCPITCDMQYYQASQSFHHWSISGGTQRHGLTFSNCSAADKFQKQIRELVEEVSAPNDIITDGPESTAKVVTTDEPIAEGKQMPPKRPEKPPSLLPTETEQPPETPPPRLPLRTITPPANNLPSSKPLQGHTEVTPETPLLPPRPGSNQGSQLPPHTVHHTHSSVAAHKPRHVLVVTSSRQGSARQPTVSQTSNRARLPHQIGASNIQDQYSDYRDYELTVQPKPTNSTTNSNRAVHERASTSSTVSSLSTTDSICADSRAIPLPTKSKRPRNPSCVKNKDTKGQQVKLLCEVCDERFYESENVKGACRRLRRKCTSDSDGRYSPARQSTGVAKSKRCRRRTIYWILGIVCPCIGCYMLCQYCNRRGKKAYCWGSKHIPVKTKESPT